MRRTFSFRQSFLTAFAEPLLLLCFLALSACSIDAALLLANSKAPTGSVVINGGAPLTTDLAVTLTLSVSESDQMYVTNTPDCSGGGTWETFAATKSWTLPTASASNTVYVKFKDKIGIESSCYSASIAHVVSGGPLSLVSPAAGSFINANNVASVAVAGVCPNHGQNVTIDITGLATETTPCNNGTWTKTINLTAAAEGPVTFTINHSTSTAVVQTHTKDTIPATADSFAVGSGNVTTSLSTTLAMTATDAVEMYIANDSCTGGTWEAFATSKAWTLTHAESNNTIYFKVRDVAGNESACINDSIAHDSVTPTITIDAPATTTWINLANRTTFPLSGTCSEVGRTITLSVTGSAISAFTTTCSASNTWTRNYNVSGLADNATTPWEIVATITRPSGASATASKSYLKDAVAPPVPTLTNSTLLGDSTTNIAVSGTGVVSYKYMVIEPWDVVTTCPTNATQVGLAPLSADIDVATPITHALSSQGTYKVCVVSKDVAGNLSTSSATATWARDTQAPTVIGISASTADGTYDLGSVISIKVSFSEVVNVTGTPTLTLETGATDRVVNYASGTGKNILTFTYTVQAGDANADLDYESAAALALNGGTIKDANGLDANLTLPTPGSAASLAGQKNLVVQVTAGLVPILSGYPSDYSHDQNLNVTVRGGGITHYKYAVTTGTCAAATYSTSILKSTKITASIGSQPAGPLTLCVIGGSGGVFQNAADATSVTWINDKKTSLSITSAAHKRVVEGGADETITIELLSPKLYDITVHYKVSGDAVNPTHHTLASGSVVFPAGTTSQTITFSLPENALADGEKLLNFHLLGALPSTGITISTSYQAQYYIKDNDSAFSISKFSMGRSHACAITSDNALRCYGHNSFGQVGDGTNIFKETGVIIKPGTSFSQVAVGLSHTCAVTTLGALYCWGDSSKRQIGDGNNVASNIPVAIDNTTSYKAVSAGAYHTCAITTNDKLRCWGNNTFNELGVETITYSAVPIDVDSAENYSFVGAGSQSTCAITTNNDLKCWGRNANSQLGNGSNVTVTTPAVIDATVKYKYVTMGAGHACGVTLAGVLKCWGANNVGQLGNNTTVASTTPIEIDNATTYVSASVNDDVITDTNQGFSCGLTLAGTLKCWGYNVHRQLADLSQLTTFTPVNRLVPTDADAGTIYSSINIAGARACGITADGALKCWGALDGDSNRNIYSLGSGTGSYFYSRFKDVNFDFNFSTFAGSTSNSSDIANYTCGLASNKLFCWGTSPNSTSNGDGGADLLTRRPAPVWIDPETNYASIAPSRRLNMCGITTDGYIKCFGNNDGGKLAAANPDISTYVSRPRVIDPTTKYSAVYVNLHTCGITQTGILKCTGYNNAGQVGDGTTTDVTTMTSIDPGVSYLTASLGSNHTCAITTDNVLKCWGSNGSNGTVGNNGALNSNVLTPTVIDYGVGYKKVSAVAYNTCAITVANKLKCWGAAGYALLGIGLGNTPMKYPVPVDSANDYTDVQLAETHGCALRTDGEMYCWGSAIAYSSTGNIESGSTTTIGTPQRVDPGVTYTSMVLRHNSTCGKTTGGQWRCVGRFMSDNLGAVNSGRHMNIPQTSQLGLYNPTFIHKALGF